jgi:hemerythrin-like metal-binding protein
MYVDWKDEYSVGVAKFDESHKKLCGLINELHAGIVAGKGRDAQKNVIKGLVEYSMSHFGDEERLMKEYGYPDRASHKREHNEFQDKLLEFVEAYLQGSAPLSVDLLGYLVEWLERHMAVTDKKYQPFFNSKGLT